MIVNLINFPDNVIAFACKGRVTKRDYETILVPRVEQALERHRTMRLYYYIGADYAGIDTGAVWEDLKVGMEHLSRWERIAVVTDVDWITHTIILFSFLFPGEMKVFPTSDASKARDWISA